MEQGSSYFTQDPPDEILRLLTLLRQPLPGRDTQYRMAHVSRIAHIPVRDDVRNAAVLVLLFQKNTEWHTVLIKRKVIDADVHAGQISFPGGRVRHNESIESAALRECFEEIGSPDNHISILGRLTQLHIPVSNHLVFPVVAHLRQYTSWQLQESEVDFILEIPVQRFLHPETRVTAPIRLRNGVVLPDVPCFSIDDHLIWGATAMILNEFVEVFQETGIREK